MPFFSIIVPIYKVENYLDQCVRTLINQTFSDIEILLVDDGSPDSCPQMCDSYARQDSRVRVIHKPNGGLSDARNAGLDAATGEYVILVDSDDYIERNACEKLLPFAQTGCDIVIAEGVSEGAVKRLRHGSFAPGILCDARAYLKTACANGAMPMASWLYVYNRQFLNRENLRFRKGILHEDEQFTPRAFLAAGQVVESGVLLYHYMIRQDSITTGKDLRRNAHDLHEVCLELRSIYDTITDDQLRLQLIDSLAVKELSLFQQGKLYQYGKAYLHKRFVWRNARLWKTKGKAFLFCISARVYWHINHAAKRLFRS